MRYKRDNTLALDVSAVPASNVTNKLFHKIITGLGCDLPNLKSVQIHSSRRIAFVELGDHLPAAEIVAKNPSVGIIYHGIRYPVQLTVVDEDIVDVRVRDVPPQTPNHVFQETLEKYGEVLSVTSETWADYFPGVVTGVRIVRMKPAKNIPSFLTIGSSQALVSYSGQIATCRRCGLASHKSSSCKKVAAKSKQKTSAKQASESKSQNDVKQREQQQQTVDNIPTYTQEQQTSEAKGTGKPAASTNTTEPMDDDDTSSDDDGFVEVKRRRKGRKKSQQLDDDSNNNNNPAEYDDEQLKRMPQEEAIVQKPHIFSRWYDLQSHETLKKYDLL